ncbi:hypothetical protein Trydic_g5638 [Trypoxylus dichotomus]
MDGILRKEDYKGDNDSKCTAQICRKYLKQLEHRKEIILIKWPPHSPDLNPIELLWEELDQWIRKSVPDTWRKI